MKFNLRLFGLAITAVLFLGTAAFAQEYRDFSVPPVNTQIYKVPDLKIPDFKVPVQLQSVGGPPPERELHESEQHAVVCTYHTEKTMNGWWERWTDQAGHWHQQYHYPVYATFKECS